MLQGSLSIENGEVTAKLLGSFIKHIRSQSHYCCKIRSE